MNLKKILRKVGKNVISDVIPGAGTVLSVVEPFLGKIDPRATTGEELEDLIDDLPPEQQVQILAHKFDVEIEETKQQGETVRAMLEAERHSKHTTRPHIALGSFYALAGLSFCVMAVMLGAVLKSDDPLMHMINAWPVFMVILTPFATIIYQYFGKLTKEQQNRLDSVTLGGTKPGGAIGLLSQIINPKR